MTLGATMLVVNFGHVRERARQGGFTLIEVLVTFVILAVGVLGIVSLLSVSKTSEYEAVQRARAVTMADGMLERIRNNPTGLVAYVTGLGSSEAIGDGSQGTEPAPNCTDAACDPDELALHDLWSWEQVLDGTGVTVDTSTATAGLAEPRGCITFLARPPWQRSGQLLVLLQWRGLQESTDGVAAGDDVCGAGATAGSDGYRRQVTVSTFVIDGTEL
jgi:type IV pilus assembly protein PilV